MSFAGVDEKKLADAIIDGAVTKLLPSTQPLLVAVLKELIVGRSIKISGLIEGRTVKIEIA